MRRILLLVLAGCAPARRSLSPAGGASDAQGRLARAESLFADARSLNDRLDVATWLGLADSVAATRAALQQTRAALIPALDIDSSALPDSVDRRALRVMRDVVAGELRPEPEPAPAAAQDSTSCADDPRAVVGIDSLAERLYGCFGAAANDVVIDGGHLDRLTVLGLLGVTADPARRRRLFLGLEPVWRRVNGNDDAASPWRELLRRRARAWGKGPTPFARGAGAVGLAPDTVRQWLVRLLETWRATLPDTMLEPWDLYYAMSGASRTLDSRIGRADLRRVSDRYYRALGADPVALNIRYDFEPRAGKDPVAFTTFGARPGWNGHAWLPGRPYVSSTYLSGGFENLLQQLHETGHAVHIAGIRTRPAFAEWPDADLFTEAIADLATFEASDGRWQLHFLGDSASTADNLRARYFGVALDACWALFEDRLQRDPALDPNVVWAELTSRYLRTEPHAEWSWWAMRGQLIDAPSYLLNYALGAFITADLRARIKAVHGAFTLGDSTWYGFVREHIYRFGLERSSRRVMEDFLGRPLSPEALFADVARAAR
jgi:hypothetical protein